MRFSLRIFLGYFLFAGLTGWYVLTLVRDEIKPAVRQSAEEVMIDTSNLLAEMIRADFVAGRLDQGRFSAAIAAYLQRAPHASVWGQDKTKLDLRVYVTDAHGIVRLDSSGAAVGMDYSQWRDVYLTLRGQYGARTSAVSAYDPESTVMYVAAPIIDQGHIVGVLTVAKPNTAMQPYIDRARDKLWRAGLLLMLVALLAGAVFSWWLSRGIARLTAFAHEVRDGKPAPVPAFAANRELRQLAAALGEMRDRLEGKRYVEEYVHALTHELKSPLAGIRGSAELLADPLDDASHARFVGHIQSEVARMQAIVDRLLDLARLEARHTLSETEPVPLATLAHTVLAALTPQLQQRRVTVEIAPDAQVTGERFLLEQALRNLLQNACDFTPDGGEIRITAALHERGWQLSVWNDGPAIPDYALPRLFERFYSLPGPARQHKGTGLGLALTRTIAELHGGSVALDNAPGGGVRATLSLPA
ncbi:two-component system, OmpR family, sensor histidine kinase CreC [Andreprevotia lacus DSM 23236]|jgi:two-component system sensor histidine kinase CreC|uniref:histidine kinase n=1 Tax=Andreprevotia lacus DSM 23236 TaxID=1121001 RepID=A0A1W1X9W3_9NEIS|nr:two-component system sensor histidine kinase CreC [Andreprevotia lacus]SMC20795.1 two-component system, OmpR family, sensor histidine kinase CreC [Andreprevotia lacus DSM 23236]